MGLSPRKEKIIEAVVDNYITKCTPISSAEIVNSYLPAVSSATIRNELSALEEMGYLEQPHSSSGRIPTAQAYKLYVDKLMPQRLLSDSDIVLIKKHFNKKITEISELLRSTANVISEITNLTGVAFVENVRESEIQNVKIVKLTAVNALVVVITNLGILKNAVVDISGDVTDDYCNVASRLVTNAFAGRTINEVLSPDAIISEIIAEYKEIFDKVLDVIKNYMDEKNDGIMLAGGSKMLQQPEFANVAKAKAMLEILESKDVLIPLLQGARDNISISISESADDGSGLPQCAVVTTNVTSGGKNVGKAGVIGPIRMDYSKIVSVLNYIGSIVNVFGSDEKSNINFQGDNNNAE